jgi:hypothetical protein
MNDEPICQAAIKESGSDIITIIKVMVMIMVRDGV